MVFGHILALGKKALHGIGSGSNYFGGKLKQGVDWLKGTANKVDKTLKSIPMVSSIYEQAMKKGIPQLGGKSLDELKGVAETALNVGERVGGALQSRSVGEAGARLRGIGRMLPETERRALDRGLGFAESANRMLRKVF